MTFLRSVLMSFSMFSRIPVPHIEWDGKNMRYILCALPLVGVVVALAVLLWLWISDLLGFGVLLRAAGFTVIPVAVSGGVHLDGFCDTVDALSSHAPPEKKREILHDPHAGAFAVIGLAVYLLAFFALAAELAPNFSSVLLFSLGFPVSRALSALVSVFSPGSGGEGLLASFSGASDKKAAAVILPVFLAACAIAVLMISPVAGAAMLITAGLCAVYIRVMSRRRFGGMSGDLAGFFLQVCELAMLFALVIMQKVVVL